MRIFWLNLVFLAITLPGFSQTYTTENNTSDKARRAFQNGREEKGNGNTTLAIEFFQQAVKVDPKFITAWAELGDVQRDAQRWADAEASYETVVGFNPKFDPAILYELANAEFQQDKFDEAAQHAEAYLATNARTPAEQRKARRLLANARFSPGAIANPVPYKPVAVPGDVNSPHNEYTPSFTADGETMIFTRNDDGRDENMYFSVWQDSTWQPAVYIKGLNTTLNEGVQTLSPDGTFLLFTACDRDRMGDGSQGRCDIYWSQNKGDVWSKGLPFNPPVNSEAWEGQPSISADNRTILFSSGGRPGTLGGHDLWMTTRQANNKWSEPKNLGPLINTDGDERMPFLHPDGKTLYFSSDGHPGLGNKDLYLSRMQPDGSWGKPQNLGYPINTKKNEDALTVSLDGRTAYFSADWPGGKGGLDFYSFELPPIDRPQPVTYARVRVTDVVTSRVLSARLEFIDLSTGQPYFSTSTGKDGIAVAPLPAGKNYALNVNRKGYLFHSENFNLTETATFDKPFRLDVALQPLGADSAAIAAGKTRPVVLRNVFFETGSAALRRESQTELNRLAELLTENPGLRIQLNGHTDNVGDDTSNQKLSEARAKAVYDYLVGKGIIAARLKYKGFGEAQPVTTNDTVEGRQQNRRTEFILW